MPHVYYIGGPADLTKRAHSERLFNHDLLRVTPLASYPAYGDAEKAMTRSANYRLQQIGPDLFIGVYDRNSL